MTKHTQEAPADERALTLEQALRRAFSLGQSYCADADSESYSANRRSEGTRQKFEALVAQMIATPAAPERAASGSFMTREQAIEFCRKRRPGIEPTEKHIAATIDAYAALFGDMVPADFAAPERAAAEPVAWIRFCSDGTYEGPLMDCDRRMDDVRRRSGAWTPLYAAPSVEREALAALTGACRQASFALRTIAPDDPDAQFTVRIIDCALAAAAPDATPEPLGASPAGPGSTLQAKPSAAIPDAGGIFAEALAREHGTVICESGPDSQLEFSFKLPDVECLILDVLLSARGMEAREGRDAQRLDGEATTARSEGRAQNQGGPHG